jgi:hypothetical protein
MTQDEEHLRLLSIFHYVVAGLAALFALFPVFHLVFGLFIVFAPAKVDGKEEAAAAAVIGWFFVLIAALFITIGWVFAALVLAAGRFLAKRRHYLFCLVMAGVECMFMPFGTVLGIFTIIVLVREPVKQLFKANTPLQPSPATPGG